MTWKEWADAITNQGFICTQCRQRVTYGPASYVTGYSGIYCSSKCVDAMLRSGEEKP